MQYGVFHVFWSSMCRSINSLMYLMLCGVVSLSDRSVESLFDPIGPLFVEHYRTFVSIFPLPRTDCGCCGHHAFFCSSDNEAHTQRVRQDSAHGSKSSNTSQAYRGKRYLHNVIRCSKTYSLPFFVSSASGFSSSLRGEERSKCR